MSKYRKSKKTTFTANKIQKYASGNDNNLKKETNNFVKPTLFNNNIKQTHAFPSQKKRTILN